MIIHYHDETHGTQRSRYSTSLLPISIKIEKGFPKGKVSASAGGSVRRSDTSSEACDASAEDTQRVVKNICDIRDGHCPSIYLSQYIEQILHLILANRPERIVRIGRGGEGGFIREAAQPLS